MIILYSNMHHFLVHLWSSWHIWKSFNFLSERCLYICISYISILCMYKTFPIFKHITRIKWFGGMLRTNTTACLVTKYLMSGFTLSRKKLIIVAVPRFLKFQVPFSVSRFFLSYNKHALNWMPIDLVIVKCIVVLT